MKRSGIFWHIRTNQRKLDYLAHTVVTTQQLNMHRFLRYLTDWLTGSLAHWLTDIVTASFSMHVFLGYLVHLTSCIMLAILAFQPDKWRRLWGLELYIYCIFPSLDRSIFHFQRKMQKNKSRKRKREKSWKMSLFMSPVRSNNKVSVCLSVCLTSCMCQV